MTSTPSCAAVPRTTLYLSQCAAWRPSSVSLLLLEKPAWQKVGNPPLLLNANVKSIQAHPRHSSCPKPTRQIQRHGRSDKSWKAVIPATPAEEL